MFAQGILYGGVSLTLIAPLIAACIVSATFFFKKNLVFYEKFTYRLVRFFYLFSLCCSLLALFAWGFCHLAYGSIHFGQLRLMKNFVINLRLVFDLKAIIFFGDLQFYHRFDHVFFSPLPSSRPRI